MTIEDSQVSNYPDAIDVAKPKQKWHVRIVSIGAFLILSALVIIAIDMLTNSITYWQASTISRFDEDLSILVTDSVRIGGIAVFLVALLVSLKNKWYFTKRVGNVLNFLIEIGVIIFATFAFGVGMGIIFFFVLFLWDPKQMQHLSDRTMIIYRSGIVGVLLLWMILEIFLSSAVIGVTIVPPLITIPLNNVLRGYSLVSIFVVFPVYLMLPRIIKSLWGFRKNIESFWIEFLNEPMGLVGLGIISAMVILALIAPILDWAGLIYHWSELSGGIGEDLLLPPSPQHPLGTNQNGQDILSRLIYGTQVSLLVGFTASVVAVFIGTTVGLISGYFGGFIDTLLMRITDVFLSLPTLPLMLIFLVLFGQGLQNVIIVIAILGWTGTARMVRSEALSLRERPLTEAAHALGATDRYILIKHILPNTLPLILANVILGVVNAILGEAGIAFLGFVDIHGQPSWGIMLHWANKNAALLNNAWWWIIPPGLLILLTSLGFVFVSHAADKVVNPRLRGRRG